MREYIIAPAEVMSKKVQPLFILLGNGQLARSHAVAGHHYIELN